jgi:hypothetical protein
MADVKGYSTFDHIENVVLRTWNRSETIANIHQKHGEEAAEEYFTSFEEQDQLRIKTMMLLVSCSGREEILKRVQASVEVEDGEA